jgi:hypothetical protein
MVDHGLGQTFVEQSQVQMIVHFFPINVDKIKKPQIKQL